MVGIEISAMKQFGIILNPSAKINRRKTAALLKDLNDIFGESALIRPTSSSEQLRGVVDEFRREGIKFLLISGGDGTIFNTLTAYINQSGGDELPVIVPLMGGTINMIGADAGLRDEQLSICKRLNEIVRSNQNIKVTQRGLLRITDCRLKETIYGFSWIDGLLYRFLIDYYKQGAGIQVASIMTVKTILTLLSNADSGLFANIDSTVYLDGERLPHKGHVMIIASGLKRFVFGFAMYAEESTPGSTFNVIYARESYIKKYRHKLPLGLYKGLKSDRSGNFINRAVKTMRVERNTGYIVDGEIFDNDDEPTDVLIEAGPKVNILSFQGEKELTLVK